MPRELNGYTIDARDEVEAPRATHTYIDYGGGTEVGWSLIDDVWVSDLVQAIL